MYNILSHKTYLNINVHTLPCVAPRLQQLLTGSAHKVINFLEKLSALTYGKCESKSGLWYL